MNWPLVKLGELSESIMGQAPPGKECNKDGVGTPFVKAGEFGGERPIIKEWTTKPLRFAKQGDVLLCVVGATCGKINKGIDCAIGRSVAAIRADESRLDKDYMFYFLSSWTLKLRALSQGAAQTVINKEMIASLEIPLPPLKEQKRIAAILDKADNLRRKRQQAIQLADEFLRAVFLDMFGDPVTNPKGWDTAPLAELVSSKLQNGAYYPKEAYRDDGVEMVHMGDAFYDVIQRGGLQRVVVPDADLEKYKLTVNDLLISRRSLAYEGAAKPSLIPYAQEPLIFESSMIRVTPNQDKIRTRYLFQYMAEPAVKNHFIRKYVTGATIKGISQKNLEKVRILVPPAELQDEFLKIVNKIEAMALNQNQYLFSTGTLFNSITQRAFSGNL